MVVDGCPPNIPLDESDIQYDLDRRRPGQSSITTPRKEEDLAHIYSGTFQGKTLGTPICVMVMNKDARPHDYEEISQKFRPSHSDFGYQTKYGIRNWEGGGRASARETVGRVAAGAIAKKVLKQLYNVEIVACVAQIHQIKAEFDLDKVTLEEVEKTIIRCPDLEAAEKMIQCIKDARKAGDSVGGIIHCIARNVPAGWGEPVFDKLDADLAKAMLSMPAVKGFDLGSGFEAPLYKGSEHNDTYIPLNGKVLTATNRSGGVQGGISNGMPITFRVAFKPTSTIMQPQKTVTVEGKETILNPKGRHDPCVLPRAVPIVEAMTAITLLDHALRQNSLEIKQ